MPYLKVSVSRKQESELVLEVPEGFDPFRIPHDKLKELCEEQIMHLEWEDVDGLDVESHWEISEEEFDQYTNTTITPEEMRDVYQQGEARPAGSGVPGKEGPQQGQAEDGQLPADGR